MPKDREIAEPIIFTNKVDRQYMEKKKQLRQKERRDFLFTLISRLLFLALMVLYFFSDVSKIKSISVVGNEALSKEAIIEQSGLNLETRLYLFVPWWKEQKLLKNPLIKHVSVTRKEHQVVRIEVEEKKVVGYLTKNGISLLVDEGTTVSLNQGAMDYLVKIPYITGFEENSKEIVKLAKNLLKLDPLILSSISEINLFPLDYDKEQLKLHMVDSNTVYVSLVYLEHVNGYLDLVNAIKDKGVCIYFDSEKSRAYTSQCKES